ALFTHPCTSTRAHSPERPSTRSGADGASVPAGGPSGARYNTVGREGSTRPGSTGAGPATLSPVGGEPAWAALSLGPPGPRPGVNPPVPVSSARACVRTTGATGSTSAF